MDSSYGGCNHLFVGLFGKLSPDGSLRGVSMTEMKIDKPELAWQLQFEGAWPLSVAWVGDTGRLVAGNEKGELLVWQLPTAPGAEATNPTDAAASSPSEGKKENKDKKDAKKTPGLPPVKQLTGHTNGITRLVPLPDGRHVLSASLDHTIRLWDLDAPTTGEVEIVIDADSRQSEFKRTRKEDVLKQPGVKVATVSSVHTFAEHPDWVQSMAVSADGRRMVTGDAAGNLISWDLAERKVLARWKGHPWNWIIALAVSPNGDRVLASEYRYKRDDFDIPAAGLKVWDPATGKESLDVLKVQFPKLNPDDNSYGGGQMWRKFVANGLVAADFSPDGQLMAVGQGGETDTGKVHLLEAASGKLLRSVSGHQYGVCDVRFSTDGKYVVSSGRDTSVRICEVAEGKEVAQLGAPRGGQFKDWINAVAISPNQKWIAGADISGLVQVWRLVEGA